MVKDFKFIEEFSDYQNYCKAYEESLTVLKMFCKKPCLIITHHSPIFLNNRHKNSILESAFCNSLENLVLESNIKAWIFGHVHEKVDTFIGKTHLVNNSFGYFWQNKVTNFKLKRNRNMVKYWIATVLEVPRDFKRIGPSLLDKYVETYFKVTGDIPLDKELFKKTLF